MIIFSLCLVILSYFRLIKFQFDNSPDNRGSDNRGSTVIYYSSNDMNPYVLFNIGYEQMIIVRIFSFRNKIPVRIYAIYVEFIV